MHIPFHIPLALGVMIGTTLRYVLMFAVAYPLGRVAWAVALYVGRARAARARSKSEHDPVSVAEPAKPTNPWDVLARGHVQAKARAAKTALSADPFYDPLPLPFFVTADIIALAVAGFAAGRLGFYFYGVSLKPASWPGMIALDLGCLLGVCASGGMP